jgi:putative PIN family toxin of toxin-antitoxin system
MKRRVVIDTNVYVSRFLRESSTPGRALEFALRNEVVLLSRATFEELRATLSKPKLARYLDPNEFGPFLRELIESSEIVEPYTVIRACRHPKDDKFLELAIDGRADLILTGDNDLLALHPFRGISILSPMQYLGQFSHR